MLKSTVFLLPPFGHNAVEKCENNLDHKTFMDEINGRNTNVIENFKH